MYVPRLFYHEQVLETLQECREANEKLTGDWIFRGQRDSRWKLSTTFERMALRVLDDKNRYPDIEIELIREFQRRAHHYNIPNLPGRNSIIEWLAIMQHYGSPTRLLDFTRSFYAGLFFAVEDLLSLDSQYCAVWGINYKLLIGVANEIMEALREKFGPKVANFVPLEAEGKLGAWEKYCNLCLGDGKGRIFSQDDFFMTLPVEPFFMNVRMSAQQGLFMMQNDISHSFEQSLFRMLSNQAAITSKRHGNSNYSYLDKTFAEDPDTVLHLGFVTKFIIPTALRKEIMKDLDQMNINHRTLFPGLEGFAKSMGRTLEQLALRKNHSISLAPAAPPSR